MDGQGTLGGQRRGNYRSQSSPQRASEAGGQCVIRQISRVTRAGVAGLDMQVEGQLQESQLSDAGRWGLLPTGSGDC